MEHLKLIKVEDYEPYVGAETVDRIQKKAERLRNVHVTNVNSTFYGGGVAEILTSLTLLMNSLGIQTGWRVIQGAPDFFSITKRMHNGLQGAADYRLTDWAKMIYEHVILENSIRTHLQHHDIVIIHDPQPIPMVKHYKRKGPWIWRCHIDLTHPHEALWNYLVPMIEMYDAVIVSIDDYKKNLKTPQRVFMPAINPFSMKNCKLSEEDMEDRLKEYKVPTDLPIIAQISRFDRWKDPKGVIDAFNIVRQKVDCTLVLLGNAATDDPEGADVYESLLGCKDERILVLPYGDDTTLVNALQSRADIVLQKSLREGFGLTVTEAMWKGTPVIGGNVGGIRYQIKDGVNGYLVSNIEETAERVVHLLKNKKLRLEMGQKAQETVREKFLMTRYLEQYLDLFNSFETVYSLKD